MPSGEAAHRPSSPRAAVPTFSAVAHAGGAGDAAPLEPRVPELWLTFEAAAGASPSASPAPLLQPSPLVLAPSGPAAAARTMPRTAAQDDPPPLHAPSAGAEAPGQPPEHTQQMETSSESLPGSHDGFLQPGALGPRDAACNGGPADAPPPSPGAQAALAAGTESVPTSAQGAGSDVAASLSAGNTGHSQCAPSPGEAPAAARPELAAAGNAPGRDAPGGAGADAGKASPPGGPLAPAGATAKSQGPPAAAGSGAAAAKSPQPAQPQPQKVAAALRKLGVSELPVFSSDGDAAAGGEGRFGRGERRPRRANVQAKGLFKRLQDGIYGRGDEESSQTSSGGAQQKEKSDGKGAGAGPAGSSSQKGHSRAAPSAEGGAGAAARGGGASRAVLAPPGDAPAGAAAANGGVSGAATPGGGSSRAFGYFQSPAAVPFKAHTQGNSAATAAEFFLGHGGPPPFATRSDEWRSAGGASAVSLAVGYPPRLEGAASRNPRKNAANALQRKKHGGADGRRRDGSAGPLHEGDSGRWPQQPFTAERGTAGGSAALSRGLGDPSSASVVRDFRVEQLSPADGERRHADSVAASIWRVSWVDGAWKTHSVTFEPNPAKDSHPTAAAEACSSFALRLYHGFRETYVHLDGGSLQHLPPPGHLLDREADARLGRPQGSAGGGLGLPPSRVWSVEELHQRLRQQHATAAIMASRNNLAFAGAGAAGGSAVDGPGGPLSFGDPRQSGAARLVPRLVSSGGAGNADASYVAQGTPSDQGSALACAGMGPCSSGFGVPGGGSAGGGAASLAGLHASASFARPFPADPNNAASWAAAPFRAERATPSPKPGSGGEFAAANAFGGTGTLGSCGGYGFPATHASGGRAPGLSTPPQPFFRTPSSSAGRAAPGLSLPLGGASYDSSALPGAASDPRRLHAVGAHAGTAELGRELLPAAGALVGGATPPGASSGVGVGSGSLPGSSPLPYPSRGSAGPEGGRGELPVRPSFGSSGAKGPEAALPSSRPRGAAPASLAAAGKGGGAGAWLQNSLVAAALAAAAAKRTAEEQGLLEEARRDAEREALLSKLLGEDEDEEECADSFWSVSLPRLLVLDPMQGRACMFYKEKERRRRQLTRNDRAEEADDEEAAGTTHQTGASCAALSGPETHFVGKRRLSAFSCSKSEHGGSVQRPASLMEEPRRGGVDSAVPFEASGCNGDDTTRTTGLSEGAPGHAAKQVETCNPLASPVGPENDSASQELPATATGKVAAPAGIPSRPQKLATAPGVTGLVVVDLLERHEEERSEVTEEDEEFDDCFPFGSGMCDAADDLGGGQAASVYDGLLPWEFPDKTLLLLQSAMKRENAASHDDLLSAAFSAEKPDRDAALLRDLEPFFRLEKQNPYFDAHQTHKNLLSGCCISSHSSLIDVQKVINRLRLQDDRRPEEGERLARVAAEQSQGAWKRLGTVLRELEALDEEDDAELGGDAEETRERDRRKDASEGAEKLLTPGGDSRGDASALQATDGSEAKMEKPCELAEHAQPNDKPLQEKASLAAVSPRSNGLPEGADPACGAASQAGSETRAASSAGCFAVPSATAGAKEEPGEGGGAMERGQEMQASAQGSATAKARGPESASQLPREGASPQKGSEGAAAVQQRQPGDAGDRHSLADEHAGQGPQAEGLTSPTLVGGLECKAAVVSGDGRHADEAQDEGAEKNDSGRGAPPPPAINAGSMEAAAASPDRRELLADRSGREGVPAEEGISASPPRRKAGESGEKTDAEAGQGKALHHSPQVVGASDAHASTAAHPDPAPGESIPSPLSHVSGERDGEQRSAESLSSSLSMAAEQASRDSPATKDDAGKGGSAAPTPRGSASRSSGGRLGLGERQQEAKRVLGSYATRRAQKRRRLELLSSSCEEIEKRLRRLANTFPWLPVLNAAFFSSAASERGLPDCGSDAMLKRSEDDTRKSVKGASDHLARTAASLFDSPGSCFEAKMKDVVRAVAEGAKRELDDLASDDDDADAELVPEELWLARASAVASARAEQRALTDARCAAASAAAAASTAFGAAPARPFLMEPSVPAVPRSGFPAPAALASHPVEAARAAAVPVSGMGTPTSPPPFASFVGAGGERPEEAGGGSFSGSRRSSTSTQRARKKKGLLSDGGLPGSVLGTPIVSPGVPASAPGSRPGSAGDRKPRKGDASIGGQQVAGPPMDPSMPGAQVGGAGVSHCGMFRAPERLGDGPEAGSPWMPGGGPVPAECPPASDELGAAFGDAVAADHPGLLSLKAGQRQRGNASSSQASLSGRDRRRSSVASSVALFASASRGGAGPPGSVVRRGDGVGAVETTDGSDTLTSRMPSRSSSILIAPPSPIRPPGPCHPTDGYPGAPAPPHAAALQAAPAHREGGLEGRTPWHGLQHQAVGAMGGAWPCGVSAAPADGRALPFSADGEGLPHQPPSMYAHASSSEGGHSSLPAGPYFGLQRVYHGSASFLPPGAPGGASASAPPGYGHADPSAAQFAIPGSPAPGSRTPLLAGCSTAESPLVAGGAGYAGMLPPGPGQGPAQLPGTGMYLPPPSADDRGCHRGGTPPQMHAATAGAPATSSVQIARDMLPYPTSYGLMSSPHQESGSVHQREACLGGASDETGAPSRPVEDLGGSSQALAAGWDDTSTPARLGSEGALSGGNLPHGGSAGGAARGGGSSAGEGKTARRRKSKGGKEERSCAPASHTLSLQRVSAEGTVGSNFSSAPPPPDPLGQVFL
ncbi:hypothetical protein BESB_057130 [Besnoitia besnoiti]|uniref:Uncharacterized protein n=1 Tax=Besnoitia besnoiti TaxID=94643 RepID=A0A2A9MKV4_BESBE|nr:hypothetical protein BESB_057130 [Besnoitia besnoiti]PFH36062.1 hypothetical protein BESB_057130 [Besnoitia besnoiti]